MRHKPKDGEHYQTRKYTTKNSTDFVSIDKQVSNHYPYDSQRHTVTSTPRNHYNLRRGEIKYEKNEVIRVIVASIGKSTLEVFESKTICTVPKGKSSLKILAYQLALIGEISYQRKD